MASSSSAGGGDNAASSLSSSLIRRHACATFVAGDTVVRIVPSFTYGQLGLISRPVGPFRAGVDVDVPLWLGVTLRRRGLARIIPPAWMDVASLERVLAFERDPGEASFSPDLPHRHAEVARALLTACGNDAASHRSSSEIPHVDRVRLLLEDIATVRLDKIRRNVHTLSAQTLSREHHVPIIDVTGIGSLEIIAVRPFLSTAFGDHTKIATKPTAITNTTAGPAGTANTTNNNNNNATDPASNNNGVPPTSRIRRFR